MPPELTIEQKVAEVGLRLKKSQGDKFNASEFNNIVRLSGVLGSSDTTAKNLTPEVLKRGAELLTRGFIGAAKTGRNIGESIQGLTTEDSIDEEGTFQEGVPGVTLTDIPGAGRLVPRVIEPTISRAIKGTGEAISGVSSIPIEGLEKLLPEEKSVGSTNQFIENFGNSVVESSASFIPVLAGAKVAGKTGAFIASLTVNSSSEFSQLVEEGMNSSEALPRSLKIGAAQAFLDTIPALKAVSKTSRSALKQGLLVALEEGGTEGLQSFISMAGRFEDIKKPEQFKQFVDNVIKGGYKQALQEAAAGFAGGLLLGSGAAAIQKGGTNARSEEITAEKVTPEEITAEKSVVKKPTASVKEGEVRQEVASTSTAPLSEAQKRAVRSIEQANPIVDATPELAKKAANIPKGGKERGFAKRIRNLPEFKKDAATIERDADNSFTPQNMDSVVNELDSLSDEQIQKEVIDKPLDFNAEGNDVNQIAGHMVLIKRALKKKQDTAPLVAAAGKKGTVLGQLVNQFSLIKGSTPEGVVQLVEDQLREQELFLTPAQKKKLTGLASRDLRAKIAHQDLSKRFRANPTVDISQRVDEASAVADKEGAVLNNEISKVLPQPFARQLAQLMQGNLLLPVSIDRNVRGNALFAFVRGGAKTAGVGADRLISALTGTRSLSLPKPGAYLKGFATGVPKAISTVVRGGSPSGVHGEVNVRGFKPIHAFRQAFSGVNSDLLPVNARGKVPVTLRLKKLNEAIFGGPAEAFFKALTITDIPFREAARRATLEEIADLNKMTKEEKKAFIRNPDEHQDLVMEESLETVFQQQTVLTKSVQNFLKPFRDIPILGPWFEALVEKPVIPFISTPINLAHEISQFLSPSYSMGRTAFFWAQAIRKNKQAESAKPSAKNKLKKEALRLQRKGSMSLGKAVIGQSMLVAAATLVEKGLIGRGIEDDPKKRSLQFARLRPATINITGLQRFLGLRGSDRETDLRDGDELRSLYTYGLFGVASLFVANNKAFEADTGIEGSPFALVSQIPELGRAIFELTPLLGARDLMNAVSKGDEKSYQRFFKNYFSVISSVPLPNTLGALNRANDEFLRDTRTDEMSELFLQAFTSKWPFFDPSGQPIRRDILGERIRRTPKGSTPIWYQVFDSRKKALVPKNKHVKVIFDAFQKTRDAKSIPSNPGRGIIIQGKKVQLNNAQYDLLSKLIGQERKKAILRTGVFSRTWIQVKDAEKVKRLQKAYREGADRGRKLFIIQNNRRSIQ